MDRVGGKYRIEVILDHRIDQRGGSATARQVFLGPALPVAVEMGEFLHDVVERMKGR